MNPDRADLFICYNAEEGAWVNKFAHALEAQFEVCEEGHLRPFRCFFYAEDIMAGEDWHAKMLVHAVSARRFLFVISPKALVSDWCALEIHERISNPNGLDTLVCGNRREEFDPTGSPIRILARFRRWANLCDSRSFEEQVEELGGWLCRKKEHERFQVVRKSEGKQALDEPLSLEKAFCRIIPCVGLVIDKQFSQPLGCAWFNEGRQFLCDAETARVTHEALKRGEPGLCWCSSESRTLRSLIIAQVRIPQRWDESGEIYVCLNEPLPKPPCLASTPEFFLDNKLGTVVFDRVASATTQIGPVFSLPPTARIEFGCGVLVPRQIDFAPSPQPVEIKIIVQPSEIVLAGAPVYDARGRLAGYVTRGTNGAFAAISNENFRSRMVHN